MGYVTPHKKTYAGPNPDSSGMHTCAGIVALAGMHTAYGRITFDALSINADVTQK
jgi:hypothetical protein